uniref:Secreted protein n=1 Tax=Anopheles darlingi TaxID=43151 RepID=A0A2M4DPQ3_ANODA
MAKHPARLQFAGTREVNFVLLLLMLPPFLAVRHDDGEPIEQPVTDRRQLLRFTFVHLHHTASSSSCSSSVACRAGLFRWFVAVGNGAAIAATADAAAAVAAAATGRFVEHLVVASNFMFVLGEPATSATVSRLVLTRCLRWLLALVRGVLNVLVVLVVVLDLFGRERVL